MGSMGGRWVQWRDSGDGGEGVGALWGGRSEGEGTASSTDVFHIPTQTRGD